MIKQPIALVDRLDGVMSAILAQQNGLRDQILKHLSEKSGMTVQQIETCEATETAVARYCISLGAKLLSEKNLADIPGNANVGPGHPNLFAKPTVIIEYSKFTDEQVEEMGNLLQAGDNTRAGSMGNVLCMNFDYFVTLPLAFEQ